MRKEIYVTLAIFLFCGSLHGQPNTIIVPGGTKIIEKFPPEVRYLYPQFVEGEIILRNGLFSSALLNYNMLRDEIEFIQDSDTLIIARKENLRYVIIENDTFSYMRGYARLIFDQTLRVYSRDRFYLKEILRRGAMGMVNRTAAIGSYSDFESGGVPYFLVVPDDLVYRREVAYFIATSRGTLEPFKRRNILRLFRNQRSEILKYIKTNNVNFDAHEDIIKFAEFLSKL